MAVPGPTVLLLFRSNVMSSRVEAGPSSCATRESGAVWSAAHGVRHRTWRRGRLSTLALAFDGKRDQQAAGARIGRNDLRLFHRSAAGGNATAVKL